MTDSTQAVSFEDFLKAPSRLKDHKAQDAGTLSKNDMSTTRAGSNSSRSSDGRKAGSRKEKVGLTIDSDILDAIDDYIYNERKRGHRLKKNDVYEAALRQFLGIEGGGAR